MLISIRVQHLNWSWQVFQCWISCCSPVTHDYMANPIVIIVIHLEVCSLMICFHLRIVDTDLKLIVDCFCRQSSVVLGYLANSKVRLLHLIHHQYSLIIYSFVISSMVKIHQLILILLFDGKFHLSLVNVPFLHGTVILKS